MRKAPSLRPVALPASDGDWQKKTPYLFEGVTLVLEFLAQEERVKIINNLRIGGVMPTAYGYIVGTTDAHGEELDVYVASLPESDATIYVIDQVNPASGMFDEHKVMMGFSSSHEAVQTYISVFHDQSGPARLGVINAFTKDAFLSWLASDGAILKPAFDHQDDSVVRQIGSGITSPIKASATLPLARDIAGGGIIDLPDVSKGPKISASVGTDKGTSYQVYFYCGLDVAVWSSSVDTICRILDLAKEQDVLTFHIASPGGSVMLMGRMLSAIARTKAKVITIAEGCVASAATSVWAAGHERHIMPGAFFMQHMSSQMLLGKTTDIAAKADFCAAYIAKQLQHFVDIGLFTPDEVQDMIAKSSDIYISGREAIARMGVVSHR